MTIEKRIERLERTNRRYRLMFTLLAVIAVCSVGISASQDNGIPNVIRAKQFQVVDDEGNLFVLLGHGASTGRISTFDKVGHRLVTMSSMTFDGKQAGTVLTNHDGNTLVSLSATTKGDGVVVTHNRKGTKVIELGVSTKGDGFVNTHNAKGNKIVMLGATAEGDGGVSTFDKNGKQLVVLGIDQSFGGGVIKSFSETGKKSVVLSGTEDGGALAVYNNADNPVCALKVDANGNGVIIIFDRNGKYRTLKTAP